MSGQFLVPNEGLPGSGVISAYNGTTFTTFSSTTYQLEASTIVQCAPATGCPATQGFWHKAANWPTASDVVDGVVYSGAPNYTMTIGGITYTQSQLLALLPSGDLHPGDFANSLSQFIAAVLNVAAGAKLTLSGADAIAAVNTALKGVNIFCPVGTSDSICSTIPSSVTATVESYEPALDNYNSAVGLGCSEGAGLNTGSGK